MSQEAGTLERLLLFAGEALEELADHLQSGALSDFMAAHGVRVPDSVLSDAQVTGALAGARGAAQQIEAAAAPLRSALESSSSTVAAAALIVAGAEMASKIAGAIGGVRDLSGKIAQGANALSDPSERGMVIAFANELPRLMLERLALKHLDLHIEGGAALLAMLGLAEDRSELGPLDDPLRPAYRVRRLHLERLSKLAHDPAAHLRDAFGWGLPGFDAMNWFRRYANWRDARDETWHILDARNKPPVSPPALHLGFVDLSTAADVSPPGLLASWNDAINFDFTDETELGSFWQAYLDIRSRFEAGLRVVLRPDGTLTAAATGGPKLNAKLGLKMEEPKGAPITLLGLAGGTRIEARKIDVAVAVEGLQSSPFLEIKTEGLNAVLDVGGGDGFLKSISGGGRGKSDITLGASWSPTKGLKFDGSAALEIAIPAHARLGPATIEMVYLIAGFKNGEIPLEISAALRGELGPFTAVVDRVGIEFKASFPEDGGNLGPMQLDAGFKPPSGLGLSIDGGGFSGGGFLKRDPASGEYAGALELVFQDVVQVKAFGVLDTRMPDGAEAYSLVVVINAEFTPIQLSFGFTLNGVGGLLGVNRTALHDQLRAGLRDGSMNSILFPKDLIANAPRIIGDLKRMFPPQSGRYLIGPMAKLGWGTPPLVTLELGIILEIPRPGVAILGVLRVAVPADDVAILNLQVNFLGVIDFERKELSIDASLFDSRLLAFTLTGDMAVRLYWGENASFLLTAGGFHPDFTPPPLALPQLNRLAISMWAGNPRLSAEAYFAVTSNTVQFGARVELEYGVKVFNVYGFVSLDALLRFDPFHFIAEIAGQVAVRSGGSTLFSIRLELMLEGPTPWHARGRGSFEIGFIFTVTISAGFEITFGEDRDTSLPPVQARGLLEDALRADGAWRALAPARAHVSVRELGAGAGVVIPPTGALAVSQKIAPLRLPLARIGAQRVEGPNTFSIVDVTLGAGVEPPAINAVEEQFPAAQFLELSDAERLSRRSFEPFESGVEMAGGAAPRADYQTRVDVAYEVIYVRKPRRPLFFFLRDALLDLLVAGSAAGRSKLSATKRAPTGLGTPTVTLPKEHFVVVGVDDLRPHAPDMVFSTQSAAVIALRDAVRKNARLSDKLQVVSSYEAAA